LALLDDLLLTVQICEYSVSLFGDALYYFMVYPIGLPIVFNKHEIRIHNLVFYLGRHLSVHICDFEQTIAEYLVAVK
jgi:hypothetical protein